VELQPDIPFEAAMRMVVACGAGASDLLERRLPRASVDGAG
jgi:hypothetical protein